jgi:hypothetical protein
MEEKRPFLEENGIYQRKNALRKRMREKTYGRKKSLYEREWSFTEENSRYGRKEHFYEQN